MKIYLAGKIGHTDWRHKIVKDLRSAGVQDAECTSLPSVEFFRSWPVLQKAIVGEHSYTGPYFQSCDHGCFHGPSSHGVTPGFDDYHSTTRGLPPATVQRELREACFASIGISDLLFAWIESPDCYGTIAEIGFAAALNIFVATAGPKRFDDLWFATPHFHETNDLEGALAFAIADAKTGIVNKLRALAKRDYNAYLRTDHWFETRNAARERALHQCQVCSSDQHLNVHHRTYERLGCELPEDLFVLCQSCHGIFHGQGKLARMR